MLLNVVGEGRKTISLFAANKWESLVIPLSDMGFCGLGFIEYIAWIPFDNNSLIQVNEFQIPWLSERLQMWNVEYCGWLTG